VTVTGLVVVAGSTTSAMVNDPEGAAGAATPATDTILILGAFGNTTDVGAPVDTTPTVDVPRLTESVLVNASTRRRPALPAPPGPLPPPAVPPEMLMVPLVPVTVLAMSRTEPPR